MYLRQLKNTCKMINMTKTISQINLGLLAKRIKIGTVSDMREKTVKKLAATVLRGVFLQ